VCVWRDLILETCMLHTKCFYTFCVLFRINCDYFTKWHNKLVFCIRVVVCWLYDIPYIQKHITHYLDKFWHSEAEQQFCHMIAKHNLEWHLANEYNGRCMCRNAQEASATFRNLNNCVPVTQLGIVGFYKVLGRLLYWQKWIWSNTSSDVNITVCGK